jgi:hypothetical protein
MPVGPPFATTTTAAAQATTVTAATASAVIYCTASRDTVRRIPQSSGDNFPHRIDAGAFLRREIQNTSMLKKDSLSKTTERRNKKEENKEGEINGEAKDKAKDKLKIQIKLS